MSGSSGSRSPRLQRALVSFQIFLLVASLVMPVAALAVEPSAAPGATPSAEPTVEPTAEPSAEPTVEATPEPTVEPSAEPTVEPAAEPTIAPTPEPTVQPTAALSVEPSVEPSPTPTAAPTKAYVVTFDAGVSAADQVTAVSGAGATTTDTIGVLRIHAVSASDAAVDALRADERVDAVELDRSRAVESTPDDAAYPDQWALPMIGWDQVYGTVDPSGSAIVAVLDTGVDASHPDLDDNIVSGASFVAGSSWSSDANGHGTAMAGIVAAETGNGTGVAGVGFDGVNVMPITVLGADGLGRDSDIVEGLVWAADHGADVALMAFSANGYSSALQAAIDYAWSKGMVLVAAAGNDGSSTPAFPAGDAGVVGVSNTTSSDTFANGSNTGAAVFLGAPGTGILTTGQGGTNYVSGTSAAAAHVAGAAGLLAAIDPSASNGTIVGRLARNADPVGTAAQTGNGRLNLVRALDDTAVDAVKPAGAAPIGDGGPFVGPYVAAANSFAVTPTPISVAAGSTNNDFEWTLTAQNSGNVPTSTFTINANWPAPQMTTPAAANYVAVVAGTCAATLVSVSARVLTIDQGAGSNTCTNGQDFKLRYENVTAPSPAATTSYSFDSQHGTDPVITATVAANSAPTDIALSPSSIAENAGANATVGTLSSTDPDAANTFTYSLVAGTGSTGNGSFNISGSTLRATASLDFEAQSSYSVRIRTTDQGGLFFEEAFTITVTNVNETPTDIALSPSSIAENAGANATVGTLSSTDPDAGNTFTYSLVAGTGSTGNGSFNISGSTLRATASLDFEAQSSYSVRIRTTDQGGLFFEEAFTITVTNVNETPVVTLDPANHASVNEGAQHTYVFTVSDEDSGDTFSVVSVSCGVAGSQVGTTSTTASGGGFVCAFADGPASSTISVQVKDGGNALSNTATQIVTVSNVKPSITLSGSATADEGETKTYTYTVTDPGQDTHTVTTACGLNGAKVALSDTFVQATGLGSFQCFFADGPATTNVTATVTDSDGATDTDNQVVIVTVSNVAPTVTLAAGNDLSVNEGSQHTYTFSVTDPGTDTFSVVSVDCGANGSQVGTTSTTAAGGSFVCAFPDGPASSSVSVQVKDSDDLPSNTASQTVAIANVDPIVTLTGDTTANEGATKTYSFTVIDPGADTFVLDVTSCGTGGSQVGPDTFDTATGAGSFVCSFADGPASPTVSVTISDSDGAADSDTVDVTVSNVKPSITLSGSATADEGETKTYTYTVTDPGQDTHTVTTACGLNGAKVALSDTFVQATGLGSFQCFFADGPATTNVTATVTDSDGATDTDNQVVIVTVSNVAPTVTLAAGNDLSVNEGSQHTYTFSVTDPGTDTFSVVSVDCGANGSQVGTTSTTAAGGSFVCAFPDGPASSSVSVQVKDSDDLPSNTASQTVAIANVDPIVTLTGDTTANEGATKTYSFTVIDPGADTFVLDVTSCGTGGSQVGPDTFDTATGAGSFVCSFADGPASPTVSVTISDSDGAADSDTVDVTVSNVKPSITLSGSATADEGETKTYTYTVTDPGQDTHTVTTACGLNGAKVALSDTFVQATGLGSFQCFFADGPATTNVTATVTDSDGATDTDNQVVIVTVSNVAPTVTLAAGNDLSVNEGSQHTYTFSVTDPGTDTFSVVSVDCGANGSQVGTTSTTAAGGSFVCAFPDGPASSSVSVQVKDSDDLPSNTASQTVAIANVDPIVTLTGDTTANEGATKTYSFTVIDPGADTFVLDVTSCGTGGSQVGPDTFDTATGAGSFVCSFADGPASPTVSVTISDSDGAADSDTVDVTVSNVKPSITLSGSATADEGETKTYTYTVTDPGQDTHTVTTACGLNGAKVALSDTFVQATGLGSFQCFFADGPATTNVTATVTDSDGATDTDNQVVIVTVSNVAPTVTLAAGNDLSVNEGSQHTYTFSVTDPGTDTFSVVSVDCGANGSQVGTTSTTAAGGSFVCAFPDGPASSSVSVQVKDSDDLPSNTASQTVAIANVDPIVALSGASSTNEGATYSLTLGAVTDPGVDTITSYIVHWGDGATSTYTTAGVKTHVYADGPSSQAITVDLDDEDGLHLAAGTKTITVDNVAPVVTLNGDFSAAPEGTTRTYTYTATDAGNDPLTIIETCGAAATRVDTAAPNSFDCTFPDGPSSTEIKVTADDGDPTNNLGSDARTVSITNVAPTVPTVIITFDPFTHLAIATATYTDPGQDIHTATFDWGAFGVTTDKPASGGVVADSRVLPDGCFTLTVNVTIKDSDGATGAKSATFAGSADAYVTAFEAPIKDNERNIAKYGNVVPIKVRITSSCSGAAITSPILHITIAEGNVADVVPDSSPVIVAESVSNADTGTQMRVNGGGYLYNFSTKVLSQGKDYTIRIRVGSTTGPIIARALFQPKK